MGREWGIGVEFCRGGAYQNVIMGGDGAREAGVSIAESRSGNCQHSHPKPKQKRVERDAPGQVSSSRSVKD